MIPKLLPSDYIHTHIDFSDATAGWDLYDTIECEAEETSEEGHEWELTLKYPETGEHFNGLTLNQIIVAKVNQRLGPQAFRIYSINKNLDHTVSVSCQHISYDLSNVPVKPFTAIGATSSITALRTNMVDSSNPSQATYGTKFTIRTNIADPAPFPDLTPKSERELYTISFDAPKSVREILLDGEESILGKFGGDLQVDNLSIYLAEPGSNRAGQDNGATINYGADLIDLDQERNITNTITGILPYYTKEKDTSVHVTTERDETIYQTLPSTETGGLVNYYSIVKFKMEENLVLKRGYKYKFTFTPDRSGIGRGTNPTTGVMRDFVTVTGLLNTDMVKNYRPLENPLPPFSFPMDGKPKEYEFVMDPNIYSQDVSVPLDYMLFYAVIDTGYSVVPEHPGTVSNISITENPIEPIVYGDIVTKDASAYDPEVDRYAVPKIVSVEMNDYFDESNSFKEVLNPGSMIPSPVPSDRGWYELVNGVFNRSYDTSVQSGKTYYEPIDFVPTTEQVTAKGQEYINKEDVGVPEVSLTVSYADLKDKDIAIHDAVTVKFVKIGIDVKSKVTRYKYDVLKERCIEIDVGKTKESAIFTLQDAGRLRHGLIKPDRIAKASIGSDKLKANSVGASQLDASSFAGGGWTMPGDAIDDATLGGKVGTDSFKTGNWHHDPVLQSVPNNVYGGYNRDVGYLFDPSLGVPPEGMFGWTEVEDGHLTERFHSLVSSRMDQEYDFDNPDGSASMVKGMGYVLDPNFIFPNSVDASKKVQNNTITNAKIRDDQITESKLNPDVRAKWERVQARTSIIVGPQETPVAETPVGQSISVGRLNIMPGYGVQYIYFGGYNKFFSPHTLTIGGTTITILSDGDISGGGDEPDPEEEPEE